VVVCLSLVVGGLAALKIWQQLLPDDAPVIGLSCDTAWHARAGITTKSYEIVLTQAGGRIRKIWPGDEDPERILDEIDALLLAGGGDIDPQLYEGTPGAAELVDRRRDDFELALIRGGLRRDMPILGICRGIQVLNVSRGGTLRNLRDRPELSRVHGVHPGSIDAHPVQIAADSKLAGLLGAGRRNASSFHGQAIDRLGGGLLAAASAPDGVVEAVELPGQRFVIAVQWHPELPPAQMEVFEAFLKAAEGYRKRRQQ
jgi:gamma-glutamyl-gamma-aminobutyrate hydrolase PuuD